MSLKVSDLDVRYGAVHAVKGVSIEVQEGTTVSILGANGAGKSSILRAIMGIVKASGGVEFWGEQINQKSVSERSLVGMQLVPEGRLVFSGLSVEANLLAGAYNHRADAPGIKRDMDRMMEMFPILRKRLTQAAGTLSGGEQQMLAIARGLMARPKLLMMDEPTMGLAPIIIEHLFDVLQAIKKTGMTVLLVEQNARLALDVSDYAYFLQVGEMVMQGESSSMKEDPRIRKVYLGI